jgi:GT2 family glycosyltransferase
MRPVCIPGLMSTGRMETIEPPESTSGAAGSEASEPQPPAPAVPEPHEPAEIEPPEIEPPEIEPPEIEPPGVGAEEIEAAAFEAAVTEAALTEASVTEALEPDVAEGPEPEEAGAPPVVAVVVTSGDAPLLEATVESLAAQDYPALSVLVIDNASEVDPTTRIAAVLPTAFVRRLPADLGFAGAANEALRSVEGATFLLFCHDDVALDPDAVRVMVEEAYRSNAAIVGPKLVDYDQPEILLEVGMSVDHYAVPFSVIEPGEIDQEQHDGVRDVFFISHATMLVRADLFREFNGFDVETQPGSDDIDLCWRARLAGARVLVAPAARVRHRQATALGRRLTRRRLPAEARAATRARVRVLFKSYSFVALLWVLPSGFVLALGEALALAITRRWRHASAVVTGWIPARGGDLRKARATTQAIRQVDDSDVRDLMVRGSARFRSLLVQRLHAGDRLADASNRARAQMASTRDQFRRAPAILATVVGFLLLLGSRSLILTRVADIGSFQSWPGISSLWSTYTSPWRYTMVGNRAPATPVFAMMSALTTVLLGHTGLARTVVVAGALPLGVWGIYLLGRTLTGALLPAVVAATAYAVNPIARDAIARGELGPLVCFALAPFIFHALVRVTSTTDAEARGVVPRGIVTPRAAVHAVVVVGVLGAVAGSVWPPAILLTLLIALVFVVAVPFAWGDWTIVKTVCLALLGAIATVLLLLPWFATLLGADASTLGLTVHAAVPFGDLLRFDVGPAPAGWFTLGLLVTAAVPLVIASGSRLLWATRAWVLVLASFALAWVPTRMSATAPVPAPAGVLVPAALGVAIAAGLGVSALLDDMRRSRFGWRQVSAVACVVGLALPLLALAADTGSGRWQLPSNDWPTSVSWMSQLPSPGGFRVLWLGNPALLPVDSKVVDGIGFGLTRDGPGDARALWAAPQNSADDMLADAISAVRDGDTARLGHLVAPIGVRYVAVINRLAPGQGPIVPADPKLADAVSRQLDLSVSRIDEGAVIYSNDAWIPRRATVPAITPLSPATSGPAAGLALAARSNASLVAHGVNGSVHGSDPVGPGTLLWAEAADPGWHATAGGKTLPRFSAFNWTNAFPLPAHESVGLRYRAGWLPRLLIWFEIVVWILALVAWRRTRTRRSRRSVTT